MGDPLTLLMHACATAQLVAQRKRSTSDYWATVASILGDVGFHHALAAAAVVKGEPSLAVSTVVARWCERARRLDGAASEVWFELKGAEGLLLALIEEQAALETR